MSKVQIVTEVTSVPQVQIYPYINSLPTTSSKIRYLKSIDLQTKEIALILNIRYQHVRNVLNQILKKN